LLFQAQSRWVQQHNMTPKLFATDIQTSVANWYIHLVYFQSSWYIIFWFGIYEKFGIYLVYFCRGFSWDF